MTADNYQFQWDRRLEAEQKLREAETEIERLRMDKKELLVKRNSDEMQRMIDYWGKRAEKAEDEIERLKNELAKAQFQRNDRPMTREIIRALVLEVKRLRLELRQAQVMQVKNETS